MFAGLCYTEFKEKENESEVGDGRNERAASSWRPGGPGGQCQLGGSTSSETAKARTVPSAAGPRAAGRSCLKLQQGSCPRAVQERG